jgi:hypothetical protein
LIQELARAEDAADRARALQESLEAEMSRTKEELSAAQEVWFSTAID